jgi:putative transcriptional regulator
MSDSLAGKLLVASFELTDRNFRRTVILVLAHDADEGAAGVVLNRPTAVAPPERLAAWRPLAPAPAVLFNGGPISRDTLIAVAVANDSRTPERWQQIRDRLGVVDLRGDVSRARGDLAGVRLFSGYAGWQSGQLESEISAGAWFVVSARPDDVMTGTPDELWRAVLARQGGLFTTVPMDPNLN